MGTTRATKLDLFLSALPDTEECVLWPYAKRSTEDQRGRVRVGDRVTYAYKAVYERVHNTTIPNGMVVRHMCDNPTCVNPNHLELGTHKQNMEDKSNLTPLRVKGRQVRMVKGSTSVQPYITVPCDGQDTIPCDEIDPWSHPALPPDHFWTDYAE